MEGGDRCERCIRCVGVCIVQRKKQVREEGGEGGMHAMHEYGRSQSSDRVHSRIDEAECVRGECACVCVEI
jgi:hypothetical protein